MFPKYTRIYNKIITDIHQKADENGIKIEFKELLHDDSFSYFSAENKKIHVSYITTNKYYWIKDLIHESCHMDQFFERKEWFDNIMIKYNRFYEWLSKETELSKREVTNNFKAIISMEIDCDKRAIEKIKKYQLPINIQEYKQEANMYFYSISYAAKNRKFIFDFLHDRELCSKAPRVFKSNYDKIPAEFKKYIK